MKADPVRYAPLRPCFSSRCGHMPLDRFADIETVLYLLFRTDPDADPWKAHLLFSRYHLIGAEHCTDLDHLLLVAGQRLQQYRSLNLWQDHLEAYRAPCYSACRVFSVDPQGSASHFARAAHTDLFPFEQRQEEWIRFCTIPPSPKAPLSPAANGTEYTYRIHMENRSETVSVSFQTPVPVQVPEQQKPEGSRSPICIPLGDLMHCAEEMARIRPGDYTGKVLAENVLKEVHGSQVTPCSTLRIQGVTNLVGMVGSGKTTLIRVLSFWLHRNGKRAAVVLDTVADVLNLWTDLKGFGIACSPLIGRSDRIRHIQQVHEGKSSLLERDLSSLLTPCCVLDGLRETEVEAVPYGDEPCWNLRQNGHDFLCPWFELCPGSRMLRECRNTSILLTTAAGYSRALVDSTREPFLLLALRSYDLILFDECDRIQHTLDELFLPTASFDDYIRGGADENRDFQMRHSQQREQDPDRLEFSELHAKALTVMHCLLHSLKNNPSLQKSDGRTFMASLLIRDMQESSSEALHLPEETARSLNALLAPDRKHTAHDPALNFALNASCFSCSDDSLFQDAYTAWRDALGDRFPRPQNSAARHIQDEVLKLLLQLIFFERYIRDLDAAYERSHDQPSENLDLFRFVHSRFHVQRALLPSAPAGNLLGVKRTDQDDLTLFRMFAFGRSLMKDLPWLVLDSQGNPAGPHVLLMSGSSWAEGCLAFHVNRPVHYILESSPEKRSFLERTRFFLPRCQHRVSGSPPEQRREHLRLLTRSCSSDILHECTQGKVLLVVNSYQETLTVVSALRESFQDRDSCPGICMLCRNSEKEALQQQNFTVLSRGSVSRFASMPEKILVVPALAIERGHNIVDETGHSALGAVFFLARPMGIPDDLSQLGCQLNGYVEARCRRREGESPFAFQKRVRNEAVKFWFTENSRRTFGLSDLDETGQRNVTATLFILILQIFGRLARVTDVGRTPPRIYFADAAFLGNPMRRDSFDCLDSMEHYLDDLMSREDTAQIARSLYEPFWKAYKRRN